MGMGRIVVQAFVTLDGVAQGCGGPDEDREGGFGHCGWATKYDEQFDKLQEGEAVIREWEAKTEALLLGRKTYDIWAGAWGLWDEDAPGLTGELTHRYNRVPKFVASTTLTDLGWKNSHLLGPDVPGAVKKLRAERDGEIRVWGSTVLVKALAAHDLIDEYRLAVYPLVLGTGKKLFADGFTPGRFALAETRALKSGVLLNTYSRTDGA
jgi:dihydrofolate reductase